MKTKFLLGAIPALLALTSCAGIAPKAENNLFQEDGLAHEEIFGKAEFEMDGFRAPRRDPDPVLSTEPMYGVQYQVTESYVHMRLIAAVSLSDLSVDVEWSRTMYKGHGLGDQSGHVFKSAHEFESTKAYTTLANGSEEPLTIAAFNTEYGTSYDHFVVYTMLNIPKSTYDDYSIRAYVSIDGVASTKGIAATVGQTAFATFDLNRDGHFISGKFDGIHDEYAPVYDAEHVKGGDNAVYYGVELKPGDTFALVYYDKVNNVFLLNGTSRFILASGYYFNNSKNTITTNYKGTYTLYLNSGDEIHTVASNVARPVYVSAHSNWAANDSWTAIYAFNSGNSDTHWYDYRAQSSYIIDPTQYDRLIAVRMRSDASISDGWSGKYYNQTGDITYPGAPEYDEGESKVKDCLYIYADCTNYGWGTR